MFCPKCGNKLADEARFCNNCGTPVTPLNRPGQKPGSQRDGAQEPRSREPRSRGPAERAEERRSGYGAGQKYGPDTVKTGETAKAQPKRPSGTGRAPQAGRKSDGKTGLLVVLLLVVLLVAGAAIWYFVLRDGELPDIFGSGSQNTAAPAFSEAPYTQAPAVNTPAQAPKPTEEPSPIPATPTPEPEPTPTPEPETTPTPTPADGLVKSYYYKPLEDDRLYFSYADASSEILHNGIYYSAFRAMDDDPNTSWQEDVDGDGIGEYLILSFDREVTVGGIMIFPGFDQSESAWERNGRPAKLRVELSDGSTYDISLDDLREWQGYEFLSPVRTEYLKFTILDVYTGSEWDDTAITDIRAYR